MSLPQFAGRRPVPAHSPSTGRAPWLLAVLARPFAPRALATALYAALSLPLALTGTVAVTAGMLVGGALSVTPLGPWVLAGTLRGALTLARWHRTLSGALLGAPIAAPLRRRQPGALGWRRALLGDPAAWRAVCWLLLAPITAVLPLVAAVLGYVYGPIMLAYPVLRFVDRLTVRGPDGRPRHVGLALPLFGQDTVLLQVLVPLCGTGLLLVAPWLLRRAAGPHRLLLSALSAPSPAQHRIRVLEETRAHAVDDAAATLRRIERDLHDGTQARLVGLGMHLATIRELVAAGAEQPQLLSVVDAARDNAKQAVADLRDLVRGIHPPVLDQGLEAALATLASGSATPVTVTVRGADGASEPGGADGASRPSPAVESIAYFCAAELLANTAKHSGADAAAIEVRCAAGELTLTVSDDGRGGARVGTGSGLTGLVARVRTVDGTLEVHSPAGGPTVATVRLPC